MQISFYLGIDNNMYFVNFIVPGSRDSSNFASVHTYNTNIYFKVHSFDNKKELGFV